MYSGDWTFKPYYQNIVDKETREKRAEICKVCPSLNSYNFCIHCNCFMPAKTYLKKQECPLKKW